MPKFKSFELAVISVRTHEFDFYVKIGPLELHCNINGGTSISLQISLIEMFKIQNNVFNIRKNFI